MSDKNKDNRKADGAVSRRGALSGIAALGAASGMAGCATSGASPNGAEAFQGRIAPTLAQSTPAYLSDIQAPASSPNIIVIVLDDVGYSDFGCYGGEIPTPAIDALAAGGLRYSNFRTTGVCSATRASLYTGLNPHSAGIAWLTAADGGFPGYRGDLSPSAATLAETLSASGYGAYHCGKWHVNADASVTNVGPVENWPLQRGYRRARWFQGHSTDYFRPSKVFDGNQRVEIERDDYHATDDITDNAIRYVRDHVAQAPDRPFLLTIAHAAAHSPLHAPREDIAAFRGAFDEGWDAIREARLARQIALGIVPPTTRLPPRNPGVLAWAELSDAQRRLYARYMEIYAAVLHRLDHNIARLVQALRDVGAFENTLLVLLSDNGGSPDGGLTGTPNLLGSIGGISVDEALAQIDELGGADTYPMYPMGWAMASNTPFRLYKHDTHLGGVADPLIVHWPRAIAARGEVRGHYAHVCDVFPTLLASARVAALAFRRGQPTNPIQGVDFSDSFARADAPETRREQHFEMNGTRALYADGWRLVSKGRFQQPDDGWELFNLAETCNELDDQAAAHPERVAEFERRWLAAARRYDVFPIDTRSTREKSLAPFFQGSTRSRWEYFPPIDLIPEEAAPELIGRSYSIGFELAAPLRASDEGVLFAFGNLFLGHVLYLRDGRLVHEMVSRPRAMRTEARAPIGATRIQLTHRLNARPWRGAVALIADGRTLVDQAHERVVFGRVMQGLQIGRNGSAPVSNAYGRPFAFSGAILRVTIDLDTSPYSSAEMEAALRSPRRG